MKIVTEYTIVIEQDLDETIAATEVASQTKQMASYVKELIEQTQSVATKFKAEVTIQ